MAPIDGLRQSRPPVCRLEEPYGAPPCCRSALREPSGRCVELATQAPYGLGATTSDQLDRVELKSDRSGFLARSAVGERRAQSRGQLAAG